MSFKEGVDRVFYPEKLDYQQIIYQQIQDCRKAFNERFGFEDTVETLYILIQPHMRDEGKKKMFEEQIKKIDEEWEREKAEIRKVYEGRVKRAACPDIVPKPPKTPSIDYWKTKFYAIMNLLERRDLLIPVKRRGVLE